MAPSQDTPVGNHCTSSKMKKNCLKMRLWVFYSPIHINTKFRIFLFRLAIQRMKEAVKCLEDFDLSAVDLKSGSHSGESVVIEEGALAAA
jgi:hypothetical protein